MRTYPYYYFVPAGEETLFRSFSPRPNFRFLGNLFIIVTMGAQFVLYSMVAERLVDESPYWLSFRRRKSEEQAAYHTLIRINADTKPDIIKEFSSF